MATANTANAGHAEAPGGTVPVPWRSQHFLQPVGLAACGALGVLASDMGVIGFAAALLLVGAGVASGRFLAQSHQRCLADARRTEEEKPSPLGQLFSAICPVWGRQIQTCRQTGDHAVADLARDFGDMVRRLENAMSASRQASSAIGGANHGIVSVIEHSEADLGKVIETLRALQRSASALLAKVGEYSQNLTEMAADVQNIAMQIRLLALNGAIEASRAGEAGKAFAVVVGEMRRLSNESAEVGARISKKVEAVNGTLVDMFRDREASKSQEAASIESAERDIEAFRERFKGLTAGLLSSVDIMERESTELRERIASAMVAFQFQDRVSQILAHVGDGISLLESSAARGERDLGDPEAWMRRIASDYTADEEFDNLQGAANERRLSHEVQYF